MTRNITTPSGWAAASLSQDNQNEVTRRITSSGGCGGVGDDDDDDGNNFNFARANDVRKYAYLRSKVA